MTELSHKFNRCLWDCACSTEIKNLLNPSQYEALIGFLGLLVGIRNKLLSRQDLEVSQKLLEMINYEQYLRTDSSEAAFEWRLKNVQTLMSWIEDLVKGERDDPVSFADAIERLGMRELMEKKPDEEEQNAVNMMTLHAAKGLEFPNVFILGWEEGILPHRTSIDENNIEEERRLAYVGVTRAQTRLTLVMARQRKSGPSLVDQEPSRFLSEMPESDLHFINNEVQVEKATNEHGLNRAIEELLGSAGLSG